MEASSKSSPYLARPFTPTAAAAARRMQRNATKSTVGTSRSLGKREGAPMPASSQSTKIKCAKCHIELAENANFCPKCGNPRGKNKRQEPAKVIGADGQVHLRGVRSTSDLQRFAK